MEKQKQSGDFPRFWLDQVSPPGGFIQRIEFV
jgi:hypothetical protein